MVANVTHHIFISEHTMNAVLDVLTLAFRTSLCVSGNHCVDLSALVSARNICDGLRHTADKMVLPLKDLIPSQIKISNQLLVFRDIAAVRQQCLER